MSYLRDNPVLLALQDTVLGQQLVLCPPQELDLVTECLVHLKLGRRIQVRKTTVFCLEKLINPNRFRSWMHLV